MGKRPYDAPQSCGFGKPYAKTMVSASLLDKAKACVYAGNANELRLLLDSASDQTRERILLSEFDNEVGIKRPSSSNPVFIEHPNLVAAAIGLWFVDVVSCLVSYGIGFDSMVDIRDPTNDPACYKSNPLIIASMLGKVEMVRSLVNNGASIDGSNSLGDTSLLEACFEGNYAVAEFLIQKRASVNKANERGITG